MELGYRFMHDILSYPVHENNEKLVSLPEIVKKSGVKIKFSSIQRTKVSKPIFRLREGLVDNFLQSAEEMNRRGWIMKVEDAFRTRDMQNPLNRTRKTFDAIMKIILWECEGKIPEPEFIFRRLTVLIATIPKIATHMSGSAIDISVISMRNGIEIDRGAYYLEMNEKTFMESPFVSKKARENRHIVSEIMQKNGFYAYPFEFWHYSSGDAFAQFLSKSGKPAVYGPVELIDDSGTVRPIKNATRVLVQPEQLLERLKQSLKRLH